MSNIVITGASRGIGLSLARQYAADGHRVYALCRRASESLMQTSATIIEGVDVSDAEGLSRSLEALRNIDIDILINNAGVLTDESLQDPAPERLLAQFTVNAIGPLLVTQNLLDCLRPGSKVALITSRMGSMADNSSGGRYGYRMSKAALNAAGVSLAHDLQAQGVAVAILHPGYVQTEMTGGRGLLQADDSATGIRQRIKELNMHNTGTFWHVDGEVLPW